MALVSSALGTVFLGMLPYGLPINACKTVDGHKQEVRVNERLQTAVDEADGC